MVVRSGWDGTAARARGRPAQSSWTRSSGTVNAGCVERQPNSDEGERPAVPAVYRGAEGWPGQVLFTIEVGGELFALRRGPDGGTAYEWLSGPNEGYGFGSSGPPNQSGEEHREQIRAFLSMIDPATGYIGDG
jgi:hypothetical protein